MLLLNLVFLFCSCLLVRDVSSASNPSGLVETFKYQDLASGTIDEVPKKETLNVTLPTEEEKLPFSDYEAACWKLINEQSIITFALQNKVLDELDADLKDMNISKELRTAIDKITSSMRGNMKLALEALSEDSVAEYFDSLFEVSEEIIYLSNFIRDPKLDDNIFLTLIKAVSRLGRNNSIFIQQLMDECPLIRSSPSTSKPNQNRNNPL